MKVVDMDHQRRRCHNQSETKELPMDRHCCPPAPDTVSRTSFTPWIVKTLAPLAALSLWCSPGTAHAAEYRAFWVDTWGAGILSQSQVNTLLGVVGTSTRGQIRDANCNAVFIEVRRNCDACYPSSMGEPYMSGLSPTNFNALQAVINAAHDTTGGKKRLEVHCWIVTFRTSGGTVYSQHSSTPTGSLTNLDNYWPSRDDTGAEVSDRAFDPGHPLALQYTVNVAMDLVNHFDIDGIHYDYIRFTANNQGYNPTSIARYNARYGLTGQPASSDAQFQQWRRDQVSAVVRQVYARIQKSKPWVKQSGSFVTWNPSPTASTRAAFQATRPYYDVYSDWDSWLQEGIVDMAVPMTYYNWASLPNDYTKWMNFEKDRHGNRLMIIGPGIYLNSLANAISEILMTRDASPSGNHADGFCGYSYRVPYVSGTWSGFSPSLVSQVTTNWDDIPGMPWKSAPTKGHIMGTVTITGTGAWADGATVSITGPTNRSMYVDGTGFYTFIDLPTGSYGVTVSKTGYPNASATVNVAVGAVTGNMYQQDFVLGTNAPPSITSQPQNQNVNQGAQATFTVAASGSTPLYYQWRLLGTNLSGATASSYTRTNVQPADAGPYSVIITNAFGTATSSNALLTVIVPPTITTQPLSQTVTQGLNATFTVAASGTTPFAYQWRLNDGNLAGATASSCTRTNVQPSDAGSYSVLVSNPAGSATSSVATLIVEVPPTPPNITSQPQNQMVYQGSNATFTVSANGSTPLYYQWSFSGTNLAGATDSSYSRVNAQAADAGLYSVVVSNTQGTATSSNALLTVIVPPTITAQPLSQTVTQGLNATFTVSVYGTAPFSFQWRFNGADISNATASSYTRSTVQLTDAGSYAVVVTNSAGSATSADAVLTVAAPPVITAQPQSQVVNQGNNVSFNVAASGTPELYYQWQWYGTNLAGGTGTSLALTGVGTNQSGPYTVLVTNTYGAATSQLATLTVTPAFQAGALSLLWSLAPGSRSYLTVASPPNERGLAYNPLTRRVLLVSRTSPTVYVLDADSGADLWTLDKTGVTGGYTSAYYLLMAGVAEDGSVYAGNMTLYGNTTAFKLYRWANDSSTTVPTVAYSGDPGAGNSQRWGDTLDVRGAGTNTQVIIGSRNGNVVALLTTTNGINFSSKLIAVADAPTGAFGLGIAFGAGSTFWGKATAQNLRQVSFDLAVGTGTSVRNYADPAFPANVAPIGASTGLNLLGGINVGVTGNHFRLYDLRPTLTNGAPAFITSTNFATDNDNTYSGTGAVDFGGDRVYALGSDNGIIAMQIIPAVVNIPPAITVQPQPATQSVNVGQSATFTVGATGTPPPSYQWRCNGTNITGATTSSYTRYNAQPDDAGSYSVVVTNVAGSVISSNAQLTVNVPPAITTQPQDLTVNQGNDATFTVVATGTAPLVYQWYFGGLPIVGATDSRFTITNAQPAAAGDYSVEVLNVAGQVTSSNAALAVNLPPGPPQIQGVTLLSGLGLQLQVNGGPGQFAIEVSPTLSGWTQLATLTATGSVFQYIDPETNQATRFYRVRVLP